MRFSMRHLAGIALCIPVFLPGGAGAQKAARQNTPRAAVKPTRAARPGSSRVTIIVKASATVVGKTFTLGEIAEFEGSDRARIAQMQAVEIGASPLPGYSRPVYPGDVTAHLRANRIDMQRVELVAPPAIRVTRAGTEIGPDAITQAAMQAAQEAIKDIPNATLEPAQQAAGKMTVAQGKVRLLAGAVRGSAELGALIVPVSVLVDNRPAQTVEVTLRVRRKIEAVVAARQIEPRAILTESDVMLTAVELPAGFIGPVQDLAEAIGKRAKQRILPGSPLPAAALEIPPAVNANDRVKIEFIFGTIRILAPGLARQSGGIGDTIRVYAPDTKRELDAVIVSPKRVRILESADEPEEEAAPEDPAEAEE